MTIGFSLNGKSVRTDISPDQMLYETLRALGCKSIKCSCETTDCGACTIWVNGKPVLSCAYPAARADGAEITTLEGLREEAMAFAACMADEGAEQCGFCNPGFVMNVLAMKRELKDPTEEDIRIWLAGNLCRCTGYASQHRAILRWLRGEVSEEGKDGAQ